MDPDEEDFFKYLDKHLPSPPKKHGTWCRIKTRLFKLPGAATTSEKGKGKDTGTVQAPRTFAELQKAPDGTNVTQLFLNDPGKFLKKVPIFEHLQTMREYEQLDEGLKRAGKVHFILESYGGGKAAKLKPVLNTYGDEVEQTKLQQQLAEGPQFQAHWLPWKPGATTHITLDPTCAFFFTSQLAGCRLAMRRDDPIRPQIAHIAGSGERGATTATWRKRETERLYGHLSRAEILTGGSGSDLPSDSRYIGEGVNLVGVFGAAKDAWEFTMQKLDFDTFAVKEARPWGRQRAEQG